MHAWYTIDENYIAQDKSLHDLSVCVTIMSVYIYIYISVALPQSLYDNAPHSIPLCATTQQGGF